MENVASKQDLYIDIIPTAQCRLCQGSTKTVLDLGEICPSTFVPEPVVFPKAPLCLVKCQSCGCVQLSHTVDRDWVYSQYWYKSGLNKTMVKALADVVDGVNQRIELDPKGPDAVLDIGCNDGTLLKFYDGRLLRVGVDPVDNITPQNWDIFINNFFEQVDFEDMQFKAITAIAMFYDLDNPHDFLSKVKKILAPDGILVIQMMDLVRMVRTMAWDNICHEHLVYYSLPLLNEILLSNGLEIFDLETNEVNGGSIRAYIAHKGYWPKSPAANAIYDEQIWSDDPFINQFAQGVIEIVRVLQNFILREKSRGKVIDVLGASTKGNTLLQVCELGNFVRQAAEVNPEKFHLFTVGSNIPIVAQEESLDNPPDYYLVLPWHFIDFFVQKFERYLAQGGAFIVPMPRPVLIDKHGKRDLPKF